MLTIDEIKFDAVHVEMENQSNRVDQSNFEELRQLIQRFKENENRSLFSKISISNCLDFFIKQIPDIFKLANRINLYGSSLSGNTLTRLMVSYNIFYRSYYLLF